MKTKFFRKNKLPLLGRGLGGGLLLLFLCPAMLSAQTGNGVSVSNLVVTAGSPASVTFNMSWKAADMPSIKWSDTVWVFVDHNVNGKMERLDVIDATVSAGSIVKSLSPGNTKGVFVAGYARSAGAGGYSSTVTLAISQADVAGACAYVSNYRPVAEYNSGVYEFTGTPNYRLELKLPGGSTVYTSSSSPFYLPAGYTLLSFTDATGAPGVINCIPMSGDIDFAVPDNLPISQPLSFPVVENPSTPDADAITYTWWASDFNPETYTGTPFIATAPAGSGTYPVTLTAHSMGYCDLPKTKDVPVVDCLSPTTYSLSASATVICNGVSVTFTLSGSQNGATYQLYKDDSTPVGEKVVASGSSIIFNTLPEVGVYTVQTVDSGKYCSGTTVSQASVVMANALPGDIGQTQTGGSCSGTPGVIGASITTTCQSSPGVIGIKIK
jgi:hypothetical protein